MPQSKESTSSARQRSRSRERDVVPENTTVSVAGTESISRDDAGVEAVTVGASVDVGATFRFSAADEALCVRIGLERNAANMRKGTTNMRYSVRNDDDVSAQGVLGEWAFLRLFGLDTSGILDTRCCSAKNDRFDAKLSNGWTVDVKTTTRDVKNLMVGKNKMVKPAGTFALMILTHDDDARTPYCYSDGARADGSAVIARFAGMVAGREVLDMRRLRSGGGGGGMFFLYPTEVLQGWPEAHDAPCPRPPF